MFSLGWPMDYLKFERMRCLTFFLKWEVFIFHLRYFFLVKLLKWNSAQGEWISRSLTQIGLTLSRSLGLARSPLSHADWFHVLGLA